MVKGSIMVKINRMHIASADVAIAVAKQGIDDAVWAQTDATSDQVSQQCDLDDLQDIASVARNLMCETPEIIEEAEADAVDAAKGFLDNHDGLECYCKGRKFTVDLDDDKRARMMKFVEQYVHDHIADAMREAAEYYIREMEMRAELRRTVEKRRRETACV